MEIFFFFFLFTLFLLALVLFIFTIFSDHKLKPSSKNHKNLPPGSFGWPVLGETFLFGNQENFISQRMKKHSSEIFKTNILGEKTAVICGPNGNRFVFLNEQKLFTAFRPRSIQKLFPSHHDHHSSSSSVSSSSSDSVKIAREAETQILRSPGFLKREALVKYVGEMDLITQRSLKIFWESKQEDEKVRVFPFAKAHTLSLACRFFMGINDDSGFVTRLVKDFDDIAIGLHSVPLSLLPWTAFSRAIRAADRVRKELGKVIRKKKEAMATQGLRIIGSD